MILSRNKKTNVYPCKPQFYYIKVGFEGGQNYIGMFSWWNLDTSAVFSLVNVSIVLKRQSLYNAFILRFKGTYPSPLVLMQFPYGHMPYAESSETIRYL